MKQAIEAIYENGTFRLVHPDQIHLPEGQLVALVVEDRLLPEPLRLAARVYAGLSVQEIDEIEQIALDRSRFFNRQVADL